MLPNRIDGNIGRAIRGIFPTFLSCLSLLGPGRFDLLNLNRVRQTLNDATMTATHASIGIQKKAHGLLAFEIANAATLMAIAKTLKHSNDPIANFWPNDKRAFQSNAIGMETTEAS